MNPQKISIFAPFFIEILDYIPVGLATFQQFNALYY